MSNMLRLSKSGIEYLDYSWGVYSGCKNPSNVCAIRNNCWAKSIVQRFSAHYPNGFEPTWYPEAFFSPLSLNKPSVIGVGWMGDMFGDWVDPNELSGIWEPVDRKYGLTIREMVFLVMERCPQHRFLFLTKCPQNYVKWQRFPQNAAVGATAVDDLGYVETLALLSPVKARLKYLSIEPMLGPISDTGAFMKAAGVGWIIVGAATKPFRPPKVEWVEELVWACVNARLPVWLKNNLAPALPKTLPFYVPPLETPDKGEIKMQYRQEIPDW